MIKITDYKGQTHYVSHLHIVHIKEAGTSSQWHGIRSYVTLESGFVIEAKNKADELYMEVNASGGEL